MTKKHFIALADAIRRFNGYKAFGGWATPEFSREHLNVLADWCQAQNPAFNRQRWLDYIAGKCGPSGGRSNDANP